MASPRAEAKENQILERDKNREKVVLEAIRRFEEFLTSIGVPTRFSELPGVEIRLEDIDGMTEDVVRISFRADATLHSRVRIVRADVKQIYELAV